MQAANISQRVEQGFPQYAVHFAGDPELGQAETSHPFDSHPPLSQRFESAGMQLGSAEAKSILATGADGRWYQKIHNASQLERQQWDEFEERFRSAHEQSLAYRYLPETDQERELVVKFFPGVTFDGKKGPLALDHEQLRYAEWQEPVPFYEIEGCSVNDDVLHIRTMEGVNRTIKMKRFGKQQQEVLDAIGRYYSRYLSATAYQKEKSSAEESGAM